MRRPLALALSLLIVSAPLAVTLGGCTRTTGGPVPPGDAETAPAPRTATSTGESTATVAGTLAAPATASVPATEPVKTMRVKLYFGLGDRVMAVVREVPYSKAVARTALTELLKGPSAEELRGLKLHSEIPRGTRILGVSMDGRTARVDFSAEFDDGGGTLSMEMRLAQVVYTLTQYSTIESVEFYMDGELIRVFGGEGIELDGPQHPQDYYGRVPIDA